MDTRIEDKPKGKWFTDNVASAFVKGSVYLVGGLIFWACVTAFRLEYKMDQHHKDLEQRLRDIQNEAVQREARLLEKINTLQEKKPEKNFRVEQRALDYIEQHRKK
jgi:flagellar biosynthesis/type III secretory pathway M-ring protein FliF/YscJ